MIEHGITTMRLTRDIDVLGQAHPPGTLALLDATLRRAAFIFEASLSFLGLGIQSPDV